ncbi:hypothetical protein ONV78_09905 [Hahella sp. CR1]|uniref:imm11 family protein n=1 Tax=Hahella sp. CR1 TaxID=2992807 RepID=UPI00244238A4|nr:DUF1629 domain-containing protein [Hahella sp. CR1]MDG9668046.1 hypothetical protein [Hahella sp. CR1]
MKYFLFDFLGDKKEEKYCFTSKTPDGGIDSYDLIAGFRLSDEYPDGIEEVTLSLEDQFPGVELASFIGNTDKMLAFSKKAATLITSMSESEIEVVPFILYNQKGKVHSTDYVFLNPVGDRDCINWKESICTRDSEGDISTYDKVVFSKAKLNEAPHIFRVKNHTGYCLFSEELVKALLDAGHTNLVFKDIEVA